VKVYCFRMSEPTLMKARKGPPRPGLIPVRVFVSGSGKVRAHTKLVYKKPGEVDPHELEYVGPDHDKDKLHIVGRGENERSYPAIVYIREGDLDKFLNPNEQRRLDARIHAETLLANLGHAPHDLARVRKDLQAVQKEIAEENVVAKQVGKPTKNLDKLKGQASDLKDAIRSIEEHYEEVLEDIGGGKKKRRLKPKISSEDVDGLGLTVSPAVIAKLNRRVEKLVQSLPSEDVSDDDLRKIINRRIEEDAKFASERNKMFGFLKDQQSSNPGPNESKDDHTARWEATRRAIRRIITWHMKNTLADMYPSTYGALVDVTEHPFSDEPKSEPTLPETARGEAFSLSRKVAAGELLVPVHRTTIQPKGQRKRVVNKADKSLMGKMGPGGKRYLTAVEYDTLVSELMGARMAVFDSDGNAIPSAVSLPEGDIRSTLAKKVWLGGFMDTIVPIVRTTLKIQGVTQHDFERVMGAAMTGMMDALVSYGPDLGRKRYKDYSVDPVLALMNHVTNRASDFAELEALNIKGENEGDDKLASLTIRQYTSGSYGVFKKLALLMADTQRRLAARGVFEEPSLADMMETAKTMEGQFLEYVPASIREKDPNAVMAWIKEQLTKGLELELFDESQSGDEEDSADQTRRMPVGKLYSDARQWYNLQYRGGPKTMGQVGASAVRVRTYERDAKKNIRRGFRDHWTGEIKDDPKGPLILREEWVRNRDGTFKREPLRDAEGDAVRIDKSELSRLDFYRDRHGVYRRKNGSEVPRVEPDSVKYEEDKSGKLIVLDQLVPNNRAYSTFAGGSVVSPLQLEKLEVAAHIRRELFEALSRQRPGEQYVLTAEDARILDMLYFRGLPIDPYQDYHDEHDRVEERRRELSRLKGLVDPIKITSKYLKDNPGAKAAIEAWSGSKLKLGSTTTPFEMSVGNAILRMREEGAKESAIDRHRITAENKKRKLKKERKAAAEAYSSSNPEVFYPDAAPASMATEGMLNFPGVPVDAEGNPNRKLLARYLSKDIVSRIGKSADYDAALHIALRRELAEPKYGRTTSVFKPEVLDNPDLRKAARVFFETGELPAEVTVTRHPGTSAEYEERISPSKHGLRTRVAKDGTKVLERTKTEFIFPPGLPKQQPGERQPLVHDATLVDEDGKRGKTIPMYSVLTDDMVEAALEDVRRMKDLVRTRGYFDKDKPTLQLVKDLKEDAPELFISGPPLGQSKYVVDEEIEPSGEIRYVTRKQDFTRTEAKSRAERVKKLKERVKVTKGEKKKNAKKALAEAKVRYKEVIAFLDWKDRTRKAFNQRLREFRHGITEHQREPRGTVARSREVDLPIFNKKLRRSLDRWSEKLKAGKDPRADELEKWMNRSYGQDKADLNKIAALKDEISKTKNKRKLKSLQGKLAVLEARSYDAVKVHSALLDGLIHGSRFGEEYARFLADINISTDAVFDSHSIIMYEADQAFKQAMGAKDPSSALDPSGHPEIIASAEMHHPFLRFISTDQVLSVIRAIHDNMARNSDRVASRRSEVRNVLHALTSVSQAYARDENGKVIRDSKTKEPVLRDDIYTVTRKKKGRVTARGARYRGQTASNSGKTYEEHYEEVSRVLPKTGRPRVSQPQVVDHKDGSQTVVYKTPKEQVVKVTAPKQPPVPPSLQGKPEAIHIPQEHHGYYHGDVAESVTLKPPSEIPPEAPPQSMSHQARVAGYDKPPTSIGRARPPAKTKKARTGAVAVSVDKPSANEVKPIDPVTAKAIAREWSAYKRMGIPTKPKYDTPKGGEAVHTPIPPTAEHVSEVRQAYIDARSRLVRELKSQHKMKSDGKPIPRSRQAVLDSYQDAYREALSAYRGSLPSDETRQQKKVAESPSYKHPDVVTSAGRPKFAFSTQTHILGAVDAPPRGIIHVFRTL